MCMAQSKRATRTEKWTRLFWRITSTHNLLKDFMLIRYRYLLSSPSTILFLFCFSRAFFQIDYGADVIAYQNGLARRANRISGAHIATCSMLCVRWCFNFSEPKHNNIRISVVRAQEWAREREREGIYKIKEMKVQWTCGKQSRRAAGRSADCSRIVKIIAAVAIVLQRERKRIIQNV